MPYLVDYSGKIENHKVILNLIRNSRHKPMSDTNARLLVLFPGIYDAFNQFDILSEGMMSIYKDWQGYKIYTVVCHYSATALNTLKWIDRQGEKAIAIAEEEVRKELHGAFKKTQVIIVANPPLIVKNAKSAL